MPVKWDSVKRSPIRTNEKIREFRTVNKGEEIKAYQAGSNVQVRRVLMELKMPRDNTILWGIRSNHFVAVCLLD